MGLKLIPFKMRDTALDVRHYAVSQMRCGALHPPFSLPTRDERQAPIILLYKSLDLCFEPKSFLFVFSQPIQLLKNFCGFIINTGFGPACKHSLYIQPELGLFFFQLFHAGNMIFVPFFCHPFSFNLFQFLGSLEQFSNCA